MPNRYFADLSNNNTQQVNWGRYRAAGHVLVGLKATEGTGFIDRTHATRCENAHKAGVWVIHYHFAHPGQSAEAQARAFWAQLHGHFAVRDLAALDIEVTDGLSSVKIAHFVRAFDAAFRRISGHSLVGYSGESFLSSIHSAGARLAGGDRWWIAAYGPVKAHVPGVGTWAWQYTDGQQGPAPHICAGIGRCDISTLNRATYLRLLLRRPR